MSGFGISRMRAHMRRVPVVDDKNKLVGLVTDFDLALFGWNT